jgi:tetratricopeptide (TPR) repeat protein
MPEGSALGQFIKECRQSLGYTSRRVEEITRTRPGLTAISHSNLLAMEKGVNVPTFDKIVTLAQVFNIPTRHFEDRLQRDMLGTVAVVPDATWDDRMAAADRALQEGQHAQALECFIQAHTVAVEELDGADPDEQPAWRRRLAETRLQVANCRKRLGLLRVAKEELEDLLASKDLDDVMAGRAGLLVAEIYRELGNRRLALLHGRAALEAVQVDDAPGLRARVLNTLANVLDDQSDHAGAVRHYEEAMAIFERLGDRRAQGLVARNLGTSYFRCQRYDDAIRCLEEGLQVARDSMDRRGLAYGLANAARAYHINGQYDLAKERAREGKELAQAEGYIDALFVSIFYLWKVARREGQKPLARVYRDRLGILHRKLETRCEESEEWSQSLASRGDRS